MKLKAREMIKVFHAHCETRVKKIFSSSSVSLQSRLVSHGYQPAKVCQVAVRGGHWEEKKEGNVGLDVKTK